jgi:hypothetical protein
MIGSTDRLGYVPERIVYLIEDALPGLATGQGIFFTRGEWPP